jgi:arabinofuranosyltransferase
MSTLVAANVSDSRGTSRVPAVDARLVLLAVGAVLFGVGMLRTAWLCDDAYITFRTIENLVHGFGLRWNVDERVQAFTHPLWLAVLTPFFAVTDEAYFTPLAISMALALAAVWLFLTRIATSFETRLIGLATFIFSKALVEFSTSGLENPLTTFLLGVFFVVYQRRGQHVWLWVVAGLMMLNRLDAGALVVPIVAVDTWRKPWRSTVKDAAIGLGPLIAWEICSIVYYGFPFPNTAYAKLQTGVPAPALVGQGLLYLVDSLSQDPVTLLMTITAAVVCLRVDPRSTWPVMAGIALYLVGVVRVGGDFMSGRFLVAPLFCAMAAAARLRWTFAPPANVSWVVAAVVVIGLTGTTHPPITSGPDTFAAGAVYGISGVADERSFDYPNTGLLRWTRERPLPAGNWVDRGIELRTKPEVWVRANIGLTGYFAGRAPHLVDAYGLSDPLLARLPAVRPWRIGHFERRIPDGYLASIRTGANQIVDPQIATLYGQLKLITQGPLWTRERWRAIRHLNVGW